MNITDHLRQAVEASDGDHLDLHHLARVARHQGTRARRRRRGTILLASVVTVAAATAVASAATAPRGQDAAGEGRVAAGRTPTPVAGPTSAPFTGRGVVAALRSAVTEGAQGRAGAFAGQGSSDEAYGQLDWTDADGLGVTVVGVNLQPGIDYVASCTRDTLRCTRTTSRGATLTTYEEHTPVAGGVGIRRVADLLRADGVRVVASASNGRDLPKNRWDVTRRQPALSSAQLTDVVRQPWWGEQLPTRFLEQGRRLAPYDDLGSRWPNTRPTPR